LILDVAQHKYEPVWILTKDLWNSVHAQDGVAQPAWRGLIAIEKITFRRAFSQGVADCFQHRYN
jgi:Phytochelatin synthase